MYWRWRAPLPKESCWKTLANCDSCWTCSTYFFLLVLRSLTRATMKSCSFWSLSLTIIFKGGKWGKIFNMAVIMTEIVMKFENTPRTSCNFQKSIINWYTKGSFMGYWTKISNCTNSLWSVHYDTFLTILLSLLIKSWPISANNSSNWSWHYILQYLILITYTWATIFAQLSVKKSIL